MANKLPPAPIDNDPEPGSDQAKKKLRAWISTATWAQFKTWFDLIFKILKWFTTDNAGNVTLNGNLGIEGSLNGLPPQDYAGRGGLEILAPARANAAFTATTGVVGLPSGVFTTIGNIALPSGTWLILGSVNFTFPAGSGTTALVWGTTQGGTTTIQANFIATCNGLQIPSFRINGPTTIVMGAQCNFTANSCTAQGSILAIPSV